MKARISRLFRRRGSDQLPTIAIDEGSTAESEPSRLVRRPAKKFNSSNKKPRRNVDQFDVGPANIGGSRRRRNAFHSAFSVARSGRIGRQLSQAVGARNAEKVREILDGVSDIDDVGGDTTEVLHCACVNNDLATVAVLLRYGAMINAVQGTGDSAPLHVAVRNNCLGTTSLLLSHGANPNQGTKFEKRTPLHIASSLGRDEMARFLLENNARIDQGDIYGSTALQMAARMGHATVVRTLLERGADPDVYNNDGWTALHLAAESGNTSVVETLLTGRANVNSQNKFGRTPLHWACASGHVRVVELLLGRNASVTIEDRHGKTALEHAVNDSVKQLVRAALVSVEAGAVVAPPGRASSAIGQLVLIDNRPRREFQPTTTMSGGDLVERRDRGGRRGGRGGGGGEGGDEAPGSLGGGRRKKDRLGSYLIPDHNFLTVPNSVPNSVFDADHGFAELSLSPEAIHPYRSWTDFRSLQDNDSGRGSSLTTSAGLPWAGGDSSVHSRDAYAFGRLKGSKSIDWSMAQYSVITEGEMMTTTTTMTDNDDGVNVSRHATKLDSSTEHLFSVARETKMDQVTSRSAREEGGGGGMVGAGGRRSTVEQLTYHKNQLMKLKDVFRSRSGTLERGIERAMRESSAALDDGSLKYMTNSLHSNRSVMQSLQTVMDDLTVQFDGRLALAERSLAVLIDESEASAAAEATTTTTTGSVELKERPRGLDVFFGFVVSYVAQYIDGWSRLIQGLSLQPADRECRVLRMITKAASGYDGRLRLSRSLPEVRTGTTDHSLVTDLATCAVSFVQRHLDEYPTSGRGSRLIVKKVLQLVKEVFDDDDSTRIIVGNFARLASAINEEGDVRGEINIVNQ